METKKWLEFIKDSIEKFDFFNRNSKLDRILFYMVKPNECFEENVLDIKPGDKYQISTINGRFILFSEGSWKNAGNSKGRTVSAVRPISGI